MKKILISILLLSAAFLAVSKVVLAVEESVTVENTAGLCSDGIDNDGDITIDLTDSDCAAFIPAPVENTAMLCSDGIDNDGDITIDLTDSDCAAFIPAPVENTAMLCSDGIDNDGDITIDLTDSDCAAFVPVAVENTESLCSDGIDNDGDITVDLTDSDCALFIPVATSTPTSTPVIVGGGAGGSVTGGSSTGGSSGGISSGTPVSATATSTATTTITTFDTTGINMSCSNLFVHYMGYGKSNVKADVIRLQSFLNTELTLKLKVDGKFGPATLAAVKKFQAKYATSVLLPWDQAGISVNLVNRPTGYVYKTTLRQINLLLCPSANIPMPALK